MNKKSYSGVLGLGNPVPVLKRKVRIAKKKVSKFSRFALARLNPSMPEAKPDFLVIGPARSATGWMFKHLSRHPQVFIPGAKEIHFFDQCDESTGDYAFDLDNPVHWRWYWTYFRSATSYRKGDMTPAYSILPVHRIADIARNMPDVKIIYTIRDPIDRAWSGLCFGLWHGKGLKADQVSEEELMTRLMSPQLLAKGDHKTNIANWEQYYSADNFKCIFFEDVRDRPRALLEELCQFLEVDPKVLPDDGGEEKRVNTVPRVDIPEKALAALKEYYQYQRSYLEKKYDRKLDNWLL